MTAMKQTLSALIGAACGVGIMFAAFPVISRHFVGPIAGEDQMSANFEILLYGIPAVAIIGGIAGWLTGRKVFKKR